MATIASAPPLSLIERVTENIIDPVTFEFMTEAVTLFPCGHTLNEDTTIRCIAQNKLCPLDRRPIERHTPNFTVRDLAVIARDHPPEGPSAEAQHHFEKGKALADQNNYEDAIPSLIEALKASPGYEKAQAYLDFCLKPISEPHPNLKSSPKLSKHHGTLERTSSKAVTASSIAFGKAEWAKYFGNVGIEPPLPPNIDEILNSPCPIWPEKKIHETHLLTLIPKTVAREPLTLKMLGKFMKKPKQGPAAKYKRLDLGEYQDQPPTESHWTLLTRDVIPNSRTEEYAAQEKLMQQYPGYETPRVHDTIVAIFMEYVRNGIRLYSDKPKTYTICQEKYKEGRQLTVGGFATSGLYIVGDSLKENESLGLGIARTLQKVVDASSLVATLPRKPAFPEIAFGKAKWGMYFGDIGVEPPLPPNIQDILNAPCPIWPGKKVYETHLLTLIPKTVNGKRLTLKSLGKLVQKPLQGPATKYSCFSLGEYTDPPNLVSHWTLMSRDVIPNSRNEKYVAQAKLAQQYPGYEIPHTLDATVSIFMEHVQRGTCLYPNKPATTYTRCQEKYSAGMQLVVGGFAAGGLDVNYVYVDDHENYGVGLSRKF